MFAPKQYWFTISSLLKWPERAFIFISNRLGDSQKNVLIGLCILLNWINTLFFSKHENMLGFVLGSCFILPIAFILLINTLSIGAKILVFLVEKLGGYIDDFNAELIIIYSLLPIWICFSIISILLKSLNLYYDTINLVPLIYQTYLLYKGNLTLANLASKKAMLVSCIYMILPLIITGIVTILYIRFSH